MSNSGALSRSVIEVGKIFSFFFFFFLQGAGKIFALRDFEPLVPKNYRYATVPVAGGLEIHTNKCHKLCLC